MAASAVKVGGAWKVAANGYVKINGQWRIIANSYIKTPAGWQQGTLGQPPPAPTLQHTGYGVVKITNYDATLYYELSTSSGVIGVDAAGNITSSGVNSIATIKASRAAGAPTVQSGFERRAYTYHSGGQSCSNNCAPAGGPGGAGDCWCGSMNPQGDLCCGGCYGQSCSDNPPVRDGTPAGFNDAYGEWWRLT
jgi:hypothetical protein